ncbi:MAG: STAS/SEC14 domain-containing protein [Anaerolineales bacterium]
MAHELRMDADGILRLALIGNMKQEDVDAYVKDLAPFRETATETEPLFFIIDTSRLGKASSAARKAFGELAKDPRIGKSALVGVSRYVRVLAGFLAKAAGRDNIQFFDSEEEALAWLKAGDQVAHTT